MRQLVDRDRIRAFLTALGREVRVPARFYLVGGASAVLEGWRSSTADVDFAVEPESRELYAALPALKDRLDLSVEPAAPSRFIPELPGWRDRSPWIDRFGRLDVFHYDFTSQMLAKIERGHRQDEADVRSMLEHDLVDPVEALRLFGEIETELVRYPALDPITFAARVRAVLEPWTKTS
jgi:hypothetical protein